MWEGSDELEPAGPWGMVELPPTSALQSLSDATDTLERLNELQCWAEAQKARLVDRIRELYEAEIALSDEANSQADKVEPQTKTQTHAERDAFIVSLAAEEISALLRLPSRSAKTFVEQSRLLVHHHRQTLTSLECLLAWISYLRQYPGGWSWLPSATPLCPSAASSLCRSAPSLCGMQNLRAGTREEAS
ncbi:hypothetical protein [Arthrobacter sp. 35/47]|uniref:hypothetical protein n=1 Tax=Arthrobacter sp. 35/47 TaxID=269454 RepID=UPI00047EA998|nr:hypothetical protein [Arthrobacter sp. 35/47]